MCPPGLNDVAISENLVIEIRLKAIEEIAGTLATQPMLEDLFHIRLL